MAYLVKYSRNAAWHLTLQLPASASHVAFSWEPLLANFLWASHEIPLIFIACLILHQLNTKSNAIKSYKIQGTKLLQLQQFFSWNKANIKYSCKSQLYKKKKQRNTYEVWSTQYQILRLHSPKILRLHSPNPMVWAWRESISWDSLMRLMSHWGTHMSVRHWFPETVTYKIFSGVKGIPSNRLGLRDLPTSHL